MKIKILILALFLNSTVSGMDDSNSPDSAGAEPGGYSNPERIVSPNCQFRSWSDEAKVDGDVSEGESDSDGSLPSEPGISNSDFLLMQSQMAQLNRRYAQLEEFVQATRREIRLLGEIYAVSKIYLQVHKDLGTQLRAIQRHDAQIAALAGGEQKRAAKVDHAILYCVAQLKAQDQEIALLRAKMKAMESAAQKEKKSSQKDKSRQLRSSL